jgi:hypothetical protein
VSYQRGFWKGEIRRHTGYEDKIRGNPEAPPMRGGPGEFDEDDRGMDKPKLGTSQPTAVKGKDEMPLRSANVKPHRHKALHQVLKAMALRRHMADDGTTMGAPIGGGAAGGGAGA